MNDHYKKTILVTGGAGYIGSVLVRQLLEKGFKVRVVDALRSGGEALLDLVGNPHFQFVHADIRDQETMREVVPGCWGLAHLAAIVGDPACKAEPELAKSTNLDAAKMTYELASQAGCSRFVFASTCSNYGKMSDPDTYVNEESSLSPVSLYAETKVGFERYLLDLPESNACKPTCLRFSTVYGLSPRVRFDLTVNEFTKELSLGRELVVFGEQFWRPYCHVEDLARSVVAVLLSSESDVAFNVFNVGNTAENYTKQMIVDEIIKQIPGAKIKYVHKDEDPRDYRVDFSKIEKTLGFKITKRVPDGIREIKRVLDLGLISNPDDPKFSNI